MRETALCIFCKKVISSWLCLACRRKHLLCLSKFVGLSFRSFFGWSSWFAAYSWKGSLSRPLFNWRSCLENLLRIFRQSWRPGIAFNFGPCLGSIFRYRFGAHELKQNRGASGQGPQMEPKQVSKLDPKQDPKMQSQGANFDSFMTHPFTP